MGEADEFFVCSEGGPSSAMTSTSWRRRPEAKSRPRARSEWRPCDEPPSETPVVSQIFPSRMTGEDHPWPGMGTFQTMFSASLQVRGRSTASECPWAVGPRNSGQSCAGSRLKFRVDSRTRFTTRNRFVRPRNSRTDAGPSDGERAEFRFTVLESLPNRFWPGRRSDRRGRPQGVPLPIILRPFAQDPESKEPICSGGLEP